MASHSVPICYVGDPFLPLWPLLCFRAHLPTFPLSSPPMGLSRGSPHPISHSIGPKQPRKQAGSRLGFPCWDAHLGSRFGGVPVLGGPFGGAHFKVSPFGVPFGVPLRRSSIWGPLLAFPFEVSLLGSPLEVSLLGFPFLGVSIWGSLFWGSHFRDPIWSPHFGVSHFEGPHFEISPFGVPFGVLL